MNRMTPQYNTMLFCDIYSDVEEFINDYNDIGDGVFKCISEANATLLFYHLFAKYGNSPIANRDINQFKLKLFSIVHQYGPTWEKELEVQKKIRELTDDQILQGAKTIYNHAYNPSTAPSTATLEELQAINDQNTTNIKRGLLEGYSAVLDLLKTNVTGALLEKFSILFKQFVLGEHTILYYNDDEQGEE